MNILLFTQNDPFYFAEAFEYLIYRMPPHSRIVGAVVSEVSPFGREGTMIQKAKLTFDTFGWKFFMRYSLNYLRNKLTSGKNVRELFRKHHVPILDIKNSVNAPESLELFLTYQPDLLVSIGSNQIFKAPLINLAPKGCINLHTALLPQYRGLMPTFWAMKNNEEFTGVTVFFIDEGIDSGPIIIQKKVQIGNKTLEELIKYTKKIGMDAVIEAIELINTGSYNLLENNKSEMSYYSFPTRQDVKEFIRAGKKFF